MQDPELNRWKPIVLMDRILDCVIVLCLITVALLMFVQVVMRYVFNSTPHWGEIISRFLMVYACMFGFSLGIHDDTHIRITAFDRVLPAGILKALDWFCILCMFIFSVFVFADSRR